MPTRKRLRLRGFDYGQAGLYFVTFCVHEKQLLLGTVSDDVVALNALGRIVELQLSELQERVDGSSLDTYVVMPNHVHAIVELKTRTRQASPLRLGQVIGALQSGTAREINQLRGSDGARVWQRGYHDHVVRDEGDLERLRDYVETNPIRWSTHP